ncbi:60S acidic ribosomal protein P1 [Sparganum proliferum]
MLSAALLEHDTDSAQAQFNQVPTNVGTSSVRTSVPEAPNSPPNLSAPIATSTPGTSGSSARRIFAIQSLEPDQSRWPIRARVSQKATIRKWNRNGREGKLFSFTLLDESGEIRATAFNAEVDKFYDLIEAQKVYYISKATIKPAKKEYNTTKNYYEMTLNSYTQITPCKDGQEADVPETKFNFVEIGKLGSCNPGDFVDVVGIAHETGALQSITANASQRESQKLDVGLVDTSGYLVGLTIWGNEAVKFDCSTNPAVVIKSAKISDFNGRSLSTTALSLLMIAPTNIPEALRLKDWYEREGRLANFETYRGQRSGGLNLLSDCSASGVSKGDYFTCKATVTFMKKENFMYQACPTEGCNKKVINMLNGLYRCEKCARETPRYKWRPLLMVKIADFSGEQWITCFQDTAETLLGRTADDLGSMKDAQDGSRLSLVAVEVKPVVYADYTKQLRKMIDALIPTLPAELTSGRIETEPCGCGGETGGLFGLGKLLRKMMDARIPTLPVELTSGRIETEPCGCGGETGGLFGLGKLLRKMMDARIPTLPVELTSGRIETEPCGCGGETGGLFGLGKLLRKMMDARIPTLPVELTSERIETEPCGSGGETGGLFGLGKLLRKMMDARIPTLPAELTSGRIETEPCGCGGETGGLRGLHETAAQNDGRPYSHPSCRTDICVYLCSNLSFTSHPEQHLSTNPKVNNSRRIH